MKKIFGYDCETTGLPVWSQPSGDICQPHLVQLAAQLYDADTKQVIQAINLIVKPEGWEIPEEMTAIHGITNELALEVGVSEPFAVEMLLALRGDADRVAYNKTFDQRIVRIAMKRYGMDEKDIERWAEKDDHHDPMRMFQKRYGGKNTKLVDSYLKITGKTLENAHSAMADTEACMEIFFELKELEDAQAA